MVTRVSLAEQICDRLDSLQTRIKIMNKQGLYDANIYAQDIICRLFNAAYGFNLTNLNKEKVTMEGIDLGDEENRISVQVTSDNTSTKIKKTIDNYIKCKYYKSMIA